MTAALIILGATNATLLGIVTYLFFALRRTEAKVKEVLAASAQERTKAYQAIVEEAEKRVQAQNAVIEDNEQRLAAMNAMIEALPVPMQDPKKLAEAFNRLVDA